MFVKNFNEIYRQCMTSGDLAIANSKIILVDGTTMSDRYYEGTYSSHLSYTRPFLRMGVIASNLDLLGVYTYSKAEDPGDSLPVGVVFTDGTTPPTVNDYAFSGTPIAGLTNGTNISISSNVVNGDGYDEVTCLYTITNTNEEAMRISEIGIVDKFYCYQGAGTTSPRLRGSYIVERTLLESPITIEPGGIGQVTYTIRMNHPVS